MPVLHRSVDSWHGATVDVCLAVVALVLVLLPALSVGNALTGEPLSASVVGLLVGILAVGGAYPFVSGAWPVGALGEFVLAFVTATFGWGIVATIAILATGVDLAGGDPRPGAAVLGLAYVTATAVVLVASPILE